MTAKWIELVTGPLAQKKEFRAAQVRIDALAEPYRTGARAVQRYVMATCAPEDGENLVRMTTDLADLWEQAQEHGSTVRDVIGEDPVDFSETFARTYTGKRWVDKERRRLLASIAEAEGAAGTGVVDGEIEGGEPA